MTTSSTHRSKGLVGPRRTWIQLLLVMFLVEANIIFYGFNFILVKAVLRHLGNNRRDPLDGLHTQQVVMGVMLAVNVRTLGRQWMAQTDSICRSSSATPSFGGGCATCGPLTGGYNPSALSSSSRPCLVSGSYHTPYSARMVLNSGLHNLACGPVAASSSSRYRGPGVGAFGLSLGSNIITIFLYAYKTG